LIENHNKSTQTNAAHELVWRRFSKLIDFPFALLLNPKSNPPIISRSWLRRSNFKSRVG